MIIVPSGFHEWMDFSQTIALILVIITQMAILWAIRSELRRSASTMSVMSRAMAEGGDVLRRLYQVEEDLAELVMRVDQHRIPGRP